jgi:methionyl-tRNA synthetase
VFFRLSRYGAAIEEAIASGRTRVVPEKAKNEVLAFVRRGLVDFSVSRSKTRARGWGIAVPDDPEQIVYVWFDALANYLTALDYAEDGALYRRYWNESAARVQVIGKGITRFHAVYWPAILLSAGLPLPTSIVVHDYLTIDGKKIGKSLGDAIDPLHLIAEYGADVVRYWLLRHVRATETTDFTIERLCSARDAELADQLGNLVQRTVKLIERAFGGAVPRAVPSGALADRVADLDQRIRGATADHRPDRALSAIFELVEDANRFVEAEAPWRLLGSTGAGDRARLERCLSTLAAVIREVGSALAPYLPDTALRIEARIGAKTGRVEPGPPLFAKRGFSAPTGRSVSAPRSAGSRCP